MKKEFPRIFKTTKKGATQTWQVVADGNAFYTIEGILNGKLTTSIPYVCEGKNPGKKNETTPEQQALKEAQSAWQRKIDRGYSLDVNNCSEKKYFEPMLAESYKDYKHKVVYPIYSQPKLDGIRCITEMTGMWSRYGKPFVSAAHIYKILRRYMDVDPILRFDGELYCDRYKADFNKIASCVRTSKKLTPEKIKEIEDNLEYWIYDFPSFPGTFSERFDALSRLLNPVPPGIVLVRTTIINNEQELDEIYDNYRMDGIEGQIIRFDTPYECYRTQNLLKRKEFFDEEHRIIGAIEGKGNRTGTVGKFVFPFGDGDTFEANVKGTFGYLRELWEQRESMVGKLASIRYPNLTPAGKPRFGYVVAIRDYE